LTLGRQIGETSKSRIFEVAGRPDRIVKVVKWNNSVTEGNSELKESLIRDVKQEFQFLKNFGKVLAPAIPQVFGDLTLDEKNQFAWFEEERIDGVPFFDWIRTEKKTWRDPATLPKKVDEMVGWIIQSMDFLIALQTSDYTHLDFKVENIMVTKNEKGEVVLRFIDLEKARILGTWVTPNHKFSSPHITAPELFYGGEDIFVTKAHDVFSMGVMMYFLLSGTSQWDGKYFPQLLEDSLLKHDSDKSPQQNVMPTEEAFKARLDRFIPGTEWMWPFIARALSTGFSWNEAGEVVIETRNRYSSIHEMKEAFLKAYAASKGQPPAPSGLQQLETLITEVEAAHRNKNYRNELLLMQLCYGPNIQGPRHSVLSSRVLRCLGN